MLRNGTKHILSLLRVQEVTDSPLEARRMGHFTSVPPHSDQIITRKIDAPKLPSNAAVVWQIKGGSEFRQTIDLQAVARNARNPEGILVIEVAADHTALAYITAQPNVIHP